MPVSESYRDHVLERLEQVVPGIRTRSTDSGVEVYSRDLSFGLIADEVLYFKVDESNRLAYEARGMRRLGSASYYEVPVEVLEDVGELARWAGQAVAVAARKGD